MSIHPLSLNRDAKLRALLIEWSDGVSQQIPYRTLRDCCPCAGCRTPDEDGSADDSRGSPFKILSPAEVIPLEILAMAPVGNYAYHIEFSDEHNTGIYTFEMLRSIDSQA